MARPYPWELRGETGSVVTYNNPDRFIWVQGKDWYIKIDFTSYFDDMLDGYWSAIEYDQFGGFRKRLYCNKVDAPWLT